MNKPLLFNLEINTTENADGEVLAEVDIQGVIGEDFFSDDNVTKQEMRNQLKEISELSADKIIVNISSLGGDIDHGLAIHDLLAENSAEIITKVKGMTASAATVIAQAGSTREMSDNAMYLIHNAWTIGGGNANDFEALAKDLRKMDERISNIYAKRSGRNQEEFLNLMGESNGDGIWLNAEEALEFGLIDKVTEPMAIAAADKSVFKNLGLPVPKNLEDQTITEDVEETEESTDTVENTEDTQETIQETESNQSEPIENTSEEEFEGINKAARERVLYLIGQARET